MAVLKSRDTKEVVTKKNPETRRNIWSLFAPKSSRGLRVDYPELSDYEEFKSLRVVELHFVWLVACKSSPLFNSTLKDREMIRACLRDARFKISEEDKLEKFLSGDFGEKIQTAVQVMHTFEPSVRIIAKELAIKQLADIKKMVSLKLDDSGNHSSFYDKEGNVDMNKKRYYMNMVMDSGAKMGAMVERAEKGFGITQKNKKVNDKNTEASGETFTESYHDNH